MLTNILMILSLVLIVLDMIFYKKIRNKSYKSYPEVEIKLCNDGNYRYFIKEDWTKISLEEGVK